MIDKPILGEDTYLDPLFADGLIGAWLMNENSGNQVLDLSGNGNNGVLNGNVSWVAGKFGSALNFPGAVTDYVNCGSRPSLDNVVRMTIATWINVSSFAGDGNCIVDKRTAGNLILINLHTLEDAGVNARKLTVITGWSNTNGAWIGSTQLSTNTWYLVTITYDGSSVANDPVFYLNGVPETTTETTTPVGNRDDDSAADFTIGLVNQWGGEDPFRGMVDNLSFWNRILSASEMVQLYQDSFWGFKQRDSGIYTRI